jgi:ABC-type glycerol-3-phosphate transport system substrate-binding protein
MARLLLTYCYKIKTPMKKHILSFALVATMIGSIAAGCSSEKATTSTDTTATVTDTSATPPPVTTDTTKKTLPVDTTKKPPM